MAGWIANILDVKGVFLHGEFDEGEKIIYTIVTEGFEGIYGSDVILMLQENCGLKNAAKAFCRELLRAFASMVSRRINADPFIYFNWKPMGLLLWLSWIDDCAYFGRDDKA